MLTVQIWDKSQIDFVEKALQEPLGRTFFVVLRVAVKALPAIVDSTSDVSVTALWLSLSVANHVEELTERLMGFLVAGLGTEQHPLGGHVSHMGNINHLTPHLVFLQGRLDLMTL